MEARTIQNSLVSYALVSCKIFNSISKYRLIKIFGNWSAGVTSIMAVCNNPKSQSGISRGADLCLFSLFQFPVVYGPFKLDEFSYNHFLAYKQLSLEIVHTTCKLQLGMICDPNY